MLDAASYKKGQVPFYPWECLTLQLPDRDVYLVIKKEDLMMKFLVLLIHELKTINGDRGSWTGVHEALCRQYS
jgi:hypothetical protein